MIIENSKIAFEKWFREFKPLLDGELEAKLVDLKYASNFDSRQVWTLLDGGNNKSIIKNGIRNNALGYFITSERVPNNAIDLTVMC